MKPTLRSHTQQEENRYIISVTRKDFSLGLIKIVLCIVILTAGAVLGLSMCTFFARDFSSPLELYFPTKIYTANCGNDYTSLKDFIKPSHLMHRMSDDELFWRASLVPRKRRFPFKRVAKVAFMYLTRGPLPFLPLWERFFRGHEELYSIYVHSTPGYSLNVSQTSAFYGRQIPSKEVEWGDITLVDAEKRLMANALLDFYNERFVLLSEACVPLYDFPTVYNYLVNSAHSFVQSYDEDSPQARGRYNSRMYPKIRVSQWRKGSQWFELSRSLALETVAEVRYYTLFKRHCKPSCYPDEHYIPTYLNMFHGAANSNRTVTWVDWSRGGPHPAVYGGEDVTEDFVRKIRGDGPICSYNSKPTPVCFLFARKFAPNALEPLLNLSSTLMNF